MARLSEDQRRQRLVNRMTNWQRNQWARAGYPQSLKRVRAFVALKRDRSNWKPDKAEIERAIALSDRLGHSVHVGGGNYMLVIT